jgi:acetyl esterase/lipase
VERGRVILGSRRWRRVLGVGLAATAAILVAPFARDAAVTALLMTQLLRPLQPGFLERLTAPPEEVRLTFQGTRRPMEANLYVPSGGGRHAAVLLVHGVVETGKDDRRMVWLARLLARAGFVVLVPDFLGFKSLRLRVSDIGEMVDAVSHLRSLGDRVLPDRLGMIGFSYGAGPMVIAAADPRIADHVRFVVLVGGYYDLVQVIKFVTTGHYEHGKVKGYLEPSDYTRWIFLRYNLDLLRDPVDQAILARFAEHKGWGAAAAASEVPTDLTAEGRSVYNLVANRDPEMVEYLVGRLAPSIREMIEQLSPSRQVRRLAAYAIIVHSEPDPFIPHTESLAMAEAFGRHGRVRLETLGVFRHVQPALPEVTPGNVLRVYLPEGWKVYRLLFDLVRQRR